MAYIGTSPQNGVRNRFVYAATQGQTAFTGADADSKTLAISDALYTDVYQNGVKLKLTTDWSATTTTVTLVNAASANDVIEIVSFDVFGVPDTVPASTGGTFSGAISATSYGAVSGTTGTFSGNVTADKYIMVGGSQIGQDYAYLKAASTSEASLTLRKDSTGADSIDYLQMRSDGNGLISKITGAGVGHFTGVGIGTNAPSCILHASTGSSGSGLIDVARFENEGTSANDGARIQLTAGSSTSGAGIGCLGDALNSAHLVFHAGGNTERMRLTSSGSLEIASGGFKAIGIYNNTTGTGANLVVDSAGGFARSTSSRRYKNTINDATHGLTELLTLRPVTYKGNNDGDILSGGLIAEEVHDAGLTEFVTYNDDNEPDALAYGNMVSLCIKAIQELSKKNDALEARLAALEAE